MTQEYQSPIPVEPNYELSPEELNRLTSELIADKTKDISDRYRLVTVEVGSGEVYSNVARHVEQNLDFFREDDLRESYMPFEAASKFFISLDRKNQTATGVIRVIQNSLAGFEASSILRNPPFDIQIGEWIDKHNITDLNKVWDIASLGVLPEYRSGLVSLQLFRAVYKSAVESHGIEHFIAVIDQKALRQLEGFLGVAFEPLAGAEAAPYHHSELSHPVYGYLPELYEKAHGRMEAPALGKAARKAAEVLVNGVNDDSLVLDTKK